MISVILALQRPAFEFEVDPKEGLTVRAGGVPIVRGSWFQYYAPGWTKGYYSSRYGGATVKSVDNDTVQVTYRSPDGLASGTQTYHREGNRLKVQYRFDWAGDTPAKVEANAGMIWAPALEAGTLNADEKPTRALNTYAYSGSELGARRFSPDASRYEFRAPLGEVAVQASRPLTLFDARGGYNADWATGRQIWWLGASDIDVAKGQPATLDLEWRVAAVPEATGQTVTTKLPAVRNPQALLPDTRRPDLIPKPRTDQLDWDHPVEITGAYRFPIGQFDHFGEFKSALAMRFQLPAPTAKTPTVAFDGGISKMGMTPGGYRLTISPKGVSVIGEEDEGVRNAVQRLARLAFAKNGKLWLPSGTLLDEPSVEWRGVHLFVGPKARGFQQRLWTRVLHPLGFNRVVLQCERTAWESLPGIETPITMPREELVRLFAMYRGMGVEPIPLIQSFGHMEWLFANGKNLDLAMNPEVPYAVDPRKPRTQAVLKTLWNEVFDTLKPKTAHFGCDEVDMRGWPGDDALLTELWKKQIPFLGGLATSHGATPMFWGDQALAPGEAPDATFGDTKADAEARREAFPKGSFIGDWHYINDPKPGTYTKTLQLWKDADLQPIASAWYRPDNVRGFDRAATLLNCGTLQTTWAGYESSEEAMLEHANQFSAMVLAADTTWSGQAATGYDPLEVFRQMYYDEASPLKAKPGTSFGIGGALTVGAVRFGVSTDLKLGSRLVADSGSVTTLNVGLTGSGRELAVAVEALARADEGDAVASLTIKLASGKTIERTLVYGRHLRAPDDGAALTISPRSTAGGSLIRIPLGGTSVNVTGVSFKRLSSAAGLRVRGLELLE